jgi:hypothetical protein
MNAANWIGLVALILALLTFGNGLRQYARAQRVERAKFALSLVDEFHHEQGNRNAMLMLDWNSRRIEFFPDEHEKDKRSHVVTDEILISALRVHTPTAQFTLLEAAIRDTFDQFFYYLERFEYYISLNLIEADDVRPHFKYWIEILAGGNRNKNPAFAETAAKYMGFYGFDGVVRFIRRFGYDINQNGR